VLEQGRSLDAPVYWLLRKGEGQTSSACTLRPNGVVQTTESHIRTIGETQSDDQPIIGIAPSNH